MFMYCTISFTKMILCYIIYNDLNILASDSAELMEWKYMD